MAEPDSAALNGGTLETLQSQSQHLRRMRPPDLEVGGGDENRVPLRAEKLSRRESRIGLRSIFGRSRTSKDAESNSSSAATRDLASRPAGIRASLAEISNWPYGLTGARSELALPTASRTMAPVPEAPLPAQPQTQASAAPMMKHKKSISGGKPARAAGVPVKSSRGALATWDPPPLFQAYPQAIRHSQLPASTLSADAIMRLSERKGSLSLRDDLTQSSLATEVGEESAATNGEKLAEKSKKKQNHRRNQSGSSGKFEWTSKIYVLVTSGYLLQYAGDGSFDRLPEKMLHLTKDSAAFASDVIPGRHWVLQVSSALDSDGNATSDSRSLFARLPFRGTEKRHASNFLMVFESAEEMEAWITILRREIEALGGKKNLSETGKPKIEESNVVQLRAQPSQRTLVVRDPERFSRVIPADFSWQTANGVTSTEPLQRDEAIETGSMTVVDSDARSEQGGLDDISTTNSVVSHDGRQLESLRDSAHRLSFISSGQRTIVTSANSSPACSPTRDSFASQLDDPSLPPPIMPLQQDVAVRTSESLLQARPRPNAAAILDRRQSMMAMNPFIEPTVQRSTARPHSTYGAGSLSVDLGLPPTTPNFSIPHSVSRRYSLAKSPPLESGPFPGTGVAVLMDREPPARLAQRRSPPTSLPISRPLSIVADQPSPIQDEHNYRPASSRTVEEPVVEVPSQKRASSNSVSSFSRPISRGRADSATMKLPTINDNSYEPSNRRGSLVSATPKLPSGIVVPSTSATPRSADSPRRYASLHNLRPSSDIDLLPPVDNTFIFNPSHIPPVPRLPSPPPVPADDAPPRRCRSSMDHYTTSKARSQSPSSRSLKGHRNKRASMQSFGSNGNIVVPDLRTGRFSMAAAMPSEITVSFTTYRTGNERRGSSPPPPVPLASSARGGQFLAVDMQSKALLNRRSMPLLVDGPPPAPPPTCALPPIPQKMRVKA